MRENTRSYCNLYSINLKEAPMTTIIFINKDGNEQEVDAPDGISLLEVARRFDIDIEGACEGALACSTCHVILDQKQFDLLEDPSEDEEDMLDLAFGLTETSRLGCQIIVSQELEGLRVKLPAEVNNRQ